MQISGVEWAVYLLIAFSVLISGTTLVNLGLDLKREAKAYVVLLLCMSLHIFVGSLFALPWYILYSESSPAVCAGVIFVIRECLMVTTTMTTLLALERLLSLVAPFWYELHVTVRNAVLAAVAACVAMAALTGVTFVVNNLDEHPDVASGALVTLCSYIPPALVSAVMASVAVVNTALTLAFDCSFLWQLRLLNRGTSPSRRNTFRASSPEESALFRLVVALSVVSVVVNISTVAMSVWRFVDPGLMSPARTVPTFLQGIGPMASSMVFMGCTARYRQRLQRCLAGAVRVLRNTCCRHRVESLEMNAFDAQDPESHDESGSGRETGSLPEYAGQDVSGTGHKGAVQTDR